jgi:hypothetical protein
MHNSPSCQATQEDHIFSSAPNLPQLPLLGRTLLSANAVAGDQ